MTQGGRHNAAQLENSDIQVRKTGHSVLPPGPKVIVIEPFIHEIEEFHPEIKIIHRPSPPDPTTEGSFSLFAEVLLKAA